MPEGSEVKLSADLIRPLVLGKRIINAYPDKRGRYGLNILPGFTEFVFTISSEVVRVEEVNCKGKFLFWKFSNSWYMFNTFGMSGQWSPKEGKHPCFGFCFSETSPDNCETIYFNDPRHFGTIKFTNNRQELLDKLACLGWDPLAEDLQNHINSLTHLIRRSRKPIGQLLMDQKLFGGVGNYIKSESLYDSKLSPWRLGISLSSEDIQLLCNSIVRIMQTSYEHQGATIKTYQTPYGKEGNYSTLFKVYGKKLDHHGNKIISEPMPDGRTTHWAPAIQK